VFMYEQFVHSALGTEVGRVQIVCEGTCCLAQGVIFDRRRDSGVVCVFSIFNAGGSVYAPGVGMRHLEGLKNPDGLNLGICVFAYVYKEHICMYMLQGGMRSWTNCFFL